MPDVQLAGQDTPASSEVQTPEPAQVQAGADAPGAETGSDEKETPNEPKTLTLTEEELKDRIERATAKAAAKAERRAFREARELMLRTTQEPVQPQPQGDGKPSRDQFPSEEAYIDAEAEKLPGFDRDDFDALPLTPVIAQAITDSDVAPKLMAYMAQHPDEVSRIGALSPARQAVEIGKLEVKLATTAKPPKTPAPIEPVGSGASPIKSLQNMGAEDYYRERMKQRPVWARR